MVASDGPRSGLHALDVGSLAMCQPLLLLLLLNKGAISLNVSQHPEACSALLCFRCGLRSSTELNGEAMPFSRGCSFYRCTRSSPEGLLQIRYGEKTTEEIVLHLSVLCSLVFPRAPETLISGCFSIGLHSALPAPVCQVPASLLCGVSSSLPVRFSPVTPETSPSLQ